LERDLDSYGLLVPKDGANLPIVAVNRDTALLFLSLLESGPAPDFMFAMPEPESDGILRRMLFDCILELENDGKFVSGAEACSVLGIENKPVEGSVGSLEKLSIDALRYGATLIDTNGTTLAQKLYNYNRRAAKPTMRGLLPDAAACLSFLNLRRDQDGRRALDVFWSCDDGNHPWLAFTRRQFRSQRTGHMYKLYIGVAFEDLVPCLPALAEAFSYSGASQFKIAMDLDGLLRPDKLIAYFPSKDAVLDASRAVAPIVVKLKVHAVPFSAAIEGAGRLSWGVDPVTSLTGERLSWRQWICERLAAALTSVRARTPEDVTPWEFALERLRLEGVDTDNFMPTGRWLETV
jgi:hypothetical protein